MKQIVLQQMNEFYYADQRKRKVDGDFFTKPEWQAVVYGGADFRRFGVGQYL